MKITSDEYIDTDIEGANEVLSWDNDVTCIVTDHVFVWQIERDGTKLRDAVPQVNVEWEVLSIAWVVQYESREEVTFTQI